MKSFFVIPEAVNQRTDNTLAKTKTKNKKTNNGRQSTA